MSFLVEVYWENEREKKTPVSKVGACANWRRQQPGGFSWWATRVQTERKKKGIWCLGGEVMQIQYRLRA